jgi:hypothetical protein
VIDRILRDKDPITDVPLADPFLHPINAYYPGGKVPPDYRKKVSTNKNKNSHNHQKQEQRNFSAVQRIDEPLFQSSIITLIALSN